VTDPTMRFEYTLTVVLTTQFPHPDIASTLHTGLGPWCKSCTLVSSRDTHTEMAHEV
jgi:hypothetical protein